MIDQREAFLYFCHAAWARALLGDRRESRERRMPATEHPSPSGGAVSPHALPAAAAEPSAGRCPCDGAKMVRRGCTAEPRERYETRRHPATSSGHPLEPAPAATVPSTTLLTKIQRRNTQLQGGPSSTALDPESLNGPCRRRRREQEH